VRRVLRCESVTENRDQDRPTWQLIPADGPIADEINSRREWLEANRAGTHGARAKTLQDLADDGRTEDRIRQGYTGRAAIELLQNAHDAMADSGIAGHVRFVITDSALLVANEGQPFDAARVRSLTRLGSSGKRSQLHQIGYKGIGFTSVFEISDRPQVMSRDFGLAFDRAEAAEIIDSYLGDGLDGPVPARYFPLAIRAGELGADEPLVQSLFDAGAVTVIRLPLRADRDRAKVLDSVRETLVPETMLFLPVIRGISLDDGDKHSSWTRREATRTGIGRIVHLGDAAGLPSSWLVATGARPVDSTTIKDLDDPLWAGVTQLNIGVAVPWSDRGPQREYESRRLQSYFPTDDLLGRSLVLHADFYLDESRRRLELKGAGGVVTRAAADAAADLAARLVASVGTWGYPLLGACTPVGVADEAGEMLGQKLETALAEQAIARPFGGGPLRRPSNAVRLGLDLAWPRVNRLAAILSPSGDILDPGDDRGAVRDLLDRLGCEAMGAAEVAARVDLELTREPYGAALGLMNEWLDSTGLNRGEVLEVLRTRPVVQDRRERWTTPEDVERRAPTAPELPLPLLRTELREPQTQAARKFVDFLGITVLDPQTALGRLLGAIETQAFATDSEERQQALDLVYRIWQTDSSVFQAEKNRIGLIEVRARTSRARVDFYWNRADKTYFGVDWSGDRTLEQMYALLGGSQFLAESLPSAAAERNRRRTFFEALGVASVPRRVRIEPETAAQYEEWRSGGGRDAAWECSSGHPYSGRQIDGWVMDRLDAVLHNLDGPEDASALAHGLVLLGDPYGPDSTVRCLHSSHGGRAPRKSVIGYQRWRLTETPWVPVANDPSGAELQAPACAWRGLPARSQWLLVPRARLRATDAEALSLVPAERPQPAAIEAALEALLQAYPELADAPGEVRETADWLVRRLERVLTRGERRAAASPPLPALGVDGWLWSRAAVVPNVPGLPRVRGLDLLPPGRWSGLQRSYGLSVARDLVAAEFKKGPLRRGTPPLLSNVSRVHLLALLLRRGAESERTAARLAALREQAVSSLDLSWRASGTATPVPDARFLLEPIRDAKGRVTGATLYWTADERPGAVDLGRALAEHLELPDDDAEIALFLQQPSVLVAERGLTEGEIRDADQLLRTRRLYREDAPSAPGKLGQGPPPADERLDARSWQEPDASPDPGTTTPPAPVKEYIDPARIFFGARLPLEPPDRRETAPPKGKRGRTEPGAPARDLVRLLAPAPKEVQAAASGRQTEELAIAIVKRFGHHLPAVREVVDVQDEDRGWDLEFRMRDRTVIPVEVKGSSGTGAFVITANELEAARTRPEYVLYHLVGLTTSEPEMRVFRGLCDRLTEDRVTAAGWAVTKWRELQPEVYPIHQRALERAAKPTTG
jgi:hypothetical protein